MQGTDLSFRPLVVLLPQFYKHVVKLPPQMEAQKLSLSHVNVLLLLDAYPDSTLSEMSKRMSIYRSNITPIINSLARWKYLRRTPHKTDGRSVSITLTDYGCLAVEDLHRQIAHRVSELTAALTLQEHVHFQAMCIDLSELLRHMIE